MSFEGKSHLVSNVSILQGSQDPSTEKVDPQDLEEAKVSSFEESLLAKCSSSLEILPIGLVKEASSMTKG